MKIKITKADKTSQMHTLCAMQKKKM